MPTSRGRRWTRGTPMIDTSRPADRLMAIVGGTQPAHRGGASRLCEEAPVESSQPSQFGQKSFQESHRESTVQRGGQGGAADPDGGEGAQAPRTTRRGAEEKRTSMWRAVKGQQIAGSVLNWVFFRFRLASCCCFTLYVMLLEEYPTSTRNVEPNYCNLTGRGARHHHRWGSHTPTFQCKPFPNTQLFKLGSSCKFVQL